MLVRDILKHNAVINDVRRILTNDCSIFLEQSGSTPLYKSLPMTYENFHRVKVRLQKRKDGVTDVFERAFGHEFSNLRQRAVFASPDTPVCESHQEPFYVFPTNGYKFLYSKEVTNSDAEYRSVIDTLVSTMGNLSEATEIVTDLLKYTYMTTNLKEGLDAGAEVIFYGIPYYYAVRVSAFPSYTDLIQ